MLNVWASLSVRMYIQRLVFFVLPENIIRLCSVFEGHHMISVWGDHLGQYANQLSVFKDLKLKTMTTCERHFIQSQFNSIYTLHVKSVNVTNNQPLRKKFHQKIYFWPYLKLNLGLSFSSNLDTKTRHWQ